MAKHWRALAHGWRRAKSLSQCETRLSGISLEEFLDNDARVPDVAKPRRLDNRYGGVVRPGRFLRTRAILWGAVFAVVLYLAYMQAARASWILPVWVQAIVVPGILLAIYLVAVAALEFRRPEELALAKLLPELVAGLLFGTVLFALVMAVLVVAGAYTLTGPTPGPPWQPLSISIQSGVAEELVCRGAILRLLWLAFGPWWAVAGSSTLFGLFHLANPNADVVGALILILEGGPLLAAPYVLTGRLWASIGVHTAWNFAEGYIFGANVSGWGTGPSLFEAHPVAEAGQIWTGGAFGPEGSLPAVLFCVLAAAGILMIAARRRRVG